MNNETTGKNGKETDVEVIKKEGWFATRKRKAKEAKERFETEHPKLSKGLKIGGIIVAAAAVFAIGAKVGGGKKGAAVVEQLPELPEVNTPDMIALHSDVLDDILTDVPDVLDVADVVADVATEVEV